MFDSHMKPVQLDDSTGNKLLSDTVTSDDLRAIRPVWLQTPTPPMQAWSSEIDLWIEY